MLTPYEEKEHFLTQLENRIQKLRKELIAVGMKEGFSGSTTIQVSQQLDNFIFKYQQFKNSDFYEKTSD